MPSTIYPYQQVDLLRTRSEVAAIDVIYQKAILLGKPACEVPTKQNEQAGDDDSEEDEDEDSGVTDDVVRRILAS